MAISADMVKDLRKKSGAGIMECKDALKESDGDMEAALDLLRKKGISKAAKKADRSTKEGAVSGIIAGKTAVMVEIKCETDFVARNEKFQDLCKGLAEHVASSDFTEDDDAFAEQAYSADTSKKIKDVLTGNIHEIGENLVIGRRTRFDLSGPGGFGLYIHGGGSIGVLVEVSAESDDVASKPGFSELCKDLAMHTAASHPIAIAPEDVPEDVLAKEREIFEAQAKESGKPDNIIPKIVEGRVKKFFAEACLLEQAFVKDPDKSVKSVIGEKAKELGGAIKVNRFKRFQLGE